MSIASKSDWVVARDSTHKVVHVVAGVIRDTESNILIAKRPLHVHQGGKWEFPGGKIEAGESRPQALARELFEELGIKPTRFNPLIQIRHNYPDKSVLLDVWEVAEFEGEASGREGQEIRWVTPSELCNYQFPEANKPIVKAAILPSCYFITPEATGISAEEMAAKIELAILQGLKLIQLRIKTHDGAYLSEVLSRIHQTVIGHGIYLLLNSDSSGLVNDCEHDVRACIGGVHLTSSALLSCLERPNYSLVSASCHSQAELTQAQLLGLDFVTLSPVKHTLSHPSAGQVLGLEGFARLVESATLPVYALGGMVQSDIASVRALGGQGVAGIRGILVKEGQAFGN